MAEFMDFDENGEGNPRKPKIYRARPDLFASYTDNQLRKRYRFDRGSIEFLTNLVRPRLQRENKGGSLSPEMQMMACLRYLGTNAHQSVIADSLGVSQQTISNAFTAVIELLANLAPDFITFPSTNVEIRQIQADFFAVAGFPGVTGCIDCTHVRLMAPPGTEKAQYYCRKGYPSINVQAVCDSKRRFLNFVAKWPGSSHDSFILRQSAMWEAFEAGQVPGIILGDSGYPCRRWLLTPYTDPNTDAQKRFNSAQRTTCCIVEQSFGSLKRRFAILGSMSGCCRMPPEKVAKVISACIVLQNIAIDRSQPIEIGEAVQQHPDIQPNNIVYDGILNAGNAYRDTITASHFTL
jgi:hypothetical protein